MRTAPQAEWLRGLAQSKSCPERPVCLRTNLKADPVPHPLPFVQTEIVSDADRSPFGRPPPEAIHPVNRAPSNSRSCHWVCRREFSAREVQPKSTATDPPLHPRYPQRISLRTVLWRQIGLSNRSMPSRLLFHRQPQYTSHSREFRPGTAQSPAPSYPDHLTRDISRFPFAAVRKRPQA